MDRAYVLDRENGDKKPSMTLAQKFGEATAHLPAKDRKQRFETTDKDGAPVHLVKREDGERVKFHFRRASGMGQRKHHLFARNKFKWETRLQRALHNNRKIILNLNSRDFAHVKGDFSQSELPLARSLKNFVQKHKGNYVVFKTPSVKKLNRINKKINEIDDSPAVYKNIYVAYSGLVIPYKLFDLRNRPLPNLEKLYDLIQDLQISIPFPDYEDKAISFPFVIRFDPTNTTHEEIAKGNLPALRGNHFKNKNGSMLLFQINCSDDLYTHKKPFEKLIDQMAQEENRFDVLASIMVLRRTKNHDNKWKMAILPVNSIKKQVRLASPDNVIPDLGPKRFRTLSTKGVQGTLFPAHS